MRARRLTTDDLIWYCLLVVPQRELDVDDELRRRGFESFVPRRSIWQRRNRYTKSKIEKEYPLQGLTGYVFIGFWTDPPPWASVCDVDHVISPLGFNDVPSRIRGDGLFRLQLLMNRDASGVDRAALWHRSLRKGEAIAMDAKVRVQSPNDPEHVGETVYRIEGIEGNNALVVPDVGEELLAQMGILGAKPCKVPLARLRRAG